MSNGQTAAAATRFGSVSTGHTTLPSTITTSSIARQPAQWWAAIW
jgi:hypothetical protein